MAARDFAYFDQPFGALAHRGGRTAQLDAENSLAAFAAAVGLGYTHVETDVHATADGVLIAFHDDRLDRVTDAAGRIADLPWAAVREARIAGREPIPTLDELLDALPQTRFNIDIKAPGAIEPLARALVRHAAHDRVCVGSFGESRIRRFRALAGRLVATSASPSAVVYYAFGAGVRRHPGLGTPHGEVLQIPVRDEGTNLLLVKPALIDAAHRAGKLVHVWTVNDPAEMHRLIDLGVDGLVSDEIGVLKGVLTERGLWYGA